MAIQMDAIRALAVRVAASHHLEVVDVEFSGGGKFRALRVFLEKDAEERAKLKAMAEADAELDLPRGVPVEMLSGTTHEDCAAFAQDFGTLLDVEDVIPGAEYTLEVSSPGLERKLYKAEDYQRFIGSLVKLQTFTPVVLDAGKAGESKGNRQWQGRLSKFAEGVLTLDLAAVKQKGKAKKASSATQVEIALANVEKANLVAEI
ncbi:ribosome maturation factor RimP [Granulicella pectinivorans]|jgi:ribosome maturation factor RimP|uniref:Ribosome maturation factor RimP n=1 Tax=Granulicella pectinivorans TaxID=474950 RepID=A0A1I6MYZ5_9BACT|nr:ribosome maturation factor RimP [Granulicella pectinivorans]SFS20821.1 ribosome maturation factor RimP [Granulicella pectinivorans]